MKPDPPLKKDALSQQRFVGNGLILLLATGFGLGQMPLAPRTFGSLLGLVVAWWFGPLPAVWQIVAATVVFILGIPVCQRGAALLGAKDPGSVVFDEIAAFPVIFLFVPFGIESAVAGFLLFRL